MYTCTIYFYPKKLCLETEIDRNPNLVSPQNTWVPVAHQVVTLVNETQGSSSSSTETWGWECLLLSLQYLTEKPLQLWPSLFLNWQCMHVEVRRQATLLFLETASLGCCIPQQLNYGATVPASDGFWSGPCMVRAFSSGPVSGVLSYYYSPFCKLRRVWEHTNPFT